MKLVVFGPFKRLGGLLADGGIVDLNLAYAAYLGSKGYPRPEARADTHLPAKLQEFLEEGDAALKAARTALAYARKQSASLVIGPAGVKIWAPLPSLQARIVCAGGNFIEHSAGTLASRESRTITRADVELLIRETEEGKRPIAGFWKLARCVIGPDEPVVYPSRATHLDYEVELAAVIGKLGRNLPSSDEALDYVFGYTGFNDWSIRHPKDEVRRLDWVLAKNWDTSASLGPCIVTKDEVPDPYDVRLRLWVNGELRQDGKTILMIRKFHEFMAHVSRDLTLHPGDIFCSGTCYGTATDTTPYAKDGTVPTNRFLKAGDVVKIEVEGIGSMQNTIVAAG